MLKGGEWTMQNHNASTRPEAVGGVGPNFDSSAGGHEREPQITHPPPAPRPSRWCSRSRGRPHRGSGTAHRKEPSSRVPHRAPPSASTSGASSPSTWRHLPIDWRSIGRRACAIDAFLIMPPTRSAERDATLPTTSRAALDCAALCWRRHAGGSKLEPAVSQQTRHLRSGVRHQLLVPTHAWLGEWRSFVQRDLDPPQAT